MPAFPHYYQLDAMDCGPTCIRMISAYYGKHYSLSSLRNLSSVTREGVSFLGISDAAQSLGFRNIAAKVSFKQLEQEVPLPCIVHWQQNHFAVVYRIKKGRVWVADPARGLISYPREEFLRGWGVSDIGDEATGLCLILEPTPEFYAHADEKPDRSSLRLLFSYMKNYHKYLVQLFLGVLLGSLFLLIFPFLTQAVVDVGINNNDLDFITLVLLAQLILFVGITSVEVVRSWILLHLSTRVNVSLISDFLLKIMKLSPGFFHSRLMGDWLQRIGDHSRIERFLTISSLNALFSIVHMLVFGGVLVIYSLPIFLIFLTGTLLYLGWIRIFMKQRRKFDFQRFEQYSRNQSKLIELIDGIQDIKLNNSETQKRWEWERIQARLFRVNTRNLALSLWQGQGSGLIIRLVGILTTFMAAQRVVDGQLTLGAMMAITYIIGQLNSPVEQMLDFFQTAQDARISLERMAEIHDEPDEEQSGEVKLQDLPSDRTLSLRNVSFQYEGPRSPYVLRGICLDIPPGKTTAIVGISGSGKTTLMKLLLGIFEPVEGDISIGSMKLKNLSAKVWRSHCGVVLQDGYLFSDTLAANIALGDETINRKQLLSAARLACIDTFIDSLPMGYQTKIGSEGLGLSQGQKQRLLIARALYKQPEYLFFDEATNALDAANERKVIDHLGAFSKGRTSVVIAHRLSTVKNADQIVVLDKGTIVELGNHHELIEKQGVYYHLVKEQLALD
ncbi:MAG TPA: peptidase domain-containing ABC transporter [Prolixibacteraceae bacterium]|nr:peptidase domain-containing ABC transporter [Prolixibacteraceae bacterium]